MEGDTGFMVKKQDYFFIIDSIYQDRFNFSHVNA